LNVWIKFISTSNGYGSTASSYSRISLPNFHSQKVSTSLIFDQGVVLQ